MMLTSVLVGTIFESVKPAFSNRVLVLALGSLLAAGDEEHDQVEELAAKGFVSRRDDAFDYQQFAVGRHALWQLLRMVILRHRPIVDDVPHDVSIGSVGNTFEKSPATIWHRSERPTVSIWAFALSITWGRSNRIPFRWDGLQQPMSFVPFPPPISATRPISTNRMRRHWPSHDRGCRPWQRRKCGPCRASPRYSKTGFP